MSSLKKLSDQEKWAKTRSLSRTDLYFLIRYVLKRPDIERQWLFERCREVQAAPDGCLDLWAREHYKSTIITMGLTIQDIICSHGDDALRPEETFGIFSHTRPIAKGFLRQIKRELESNEMLKNLFPDILWQNPQKESPKWSEDEGIVVKRKGNPKEATIEAWGLVDGQPIGKHFKKLIYDDVVTPASVTTPDMIEKTTDAMALSFNLGSEGGAKRFIGTRYHYNDTYKTIMERGIAVPRIYPCTQDGTVTGEPVLLSKERIADKRREQGPYIFACQMLLDPKADETQGFKEEWIQKRPALNADGCNIYLVFDPASAKKKGSDYTAAWCAALRPDGKIAILDIVRDRLSLPQRIRLLFDWHRKYKPLEVRYEKYGLMADIEAAKAEMQIQNYEFNITEVGGKTPKPDRIKRLLPYFEQGKILLPESKHYTNYQGVTSDLVNIFIEQEYKAFPVSSHDDMLDSLARLFEPDLPLIWPEDEEEEEDLYIPPPSGSWMG